jgi:hypothetical protein
MLRNFEKWKPDAVWQNLLSKATVQKGCFDADAAAANDDDDDDDDACSSRVTYPEDLFFL